VRASSRRCVRSSSSHCLPASPRIRAVTLSLPRGCGTLAGVPAGHVTSAAGCAVVLWQNRRRDALKDSGRAGGAGGLVRTAGPADAWVVRFEVGPLPLAWHFIGELDLVATIDRALPQRGRAQPSAGRSRRRCAVAGCARPRRCMTSRVGAGCGPAGARAAQRRPPGPRHRDPAVYAETLRGALAARAMERFGIQTGRPHVDLTTLRVAGASERSALVAKGWAPDRRASRARCARCSPPRRRRLALVAARRLHPFLRGGTRDRGRPRARAGQGPRGAQAGQARPRRPPRQDPPPGRL